MNMRAQYNLCMCMKNLLVPASFLTLAGDLMRANRINTHTEAHIYRISRQKQESTTNFL